ncbi:MAG: hypothetical protein HZA78_10580 [Candidatus Schekmanbacteria bacterium]|nr:hypothetical protein [Candidatus Schekmanbacteria bacterium]
MGVAVLLNQAEFDCRRCTKAMKVEKGCEEDSPLPERWVIDAEAYRRCPLKLVSGLSWSAIRLYQYYRQGFLPVTGGILDQSNLFLQALEIIQGSFNEVNHEQ